MADRGDGTGGGGVATTHAEHDPELVATLLDRDETGPERAQAVRQVAACPACAALHDDLLVLATATRVLPTPVRTVDFQLTAADAASLREPLVVGARQTDEMQTAATHASHDTILVSSLADHSVSASDREAAEAIVAACGLCAALHADTLALRSAIRAMPTPARSRDFSLTPEVAARLRPAGWRRLVAAIGTPRDIFSRPLAVGLTTLGLAGLLVATLPTVLPIGSTADQSTVGRPVNVSTDGVAPVSGAGAESGGGAGAPVAPEVARSGDPVGALGAPSPGSVPRGSPDQGKSGQGDLASTAPGSPGDTTGSTNGATPTSAPVGGSLAGGDEGAPGEGGPAVPGAVLVSGLLLIAGLGLFITRWAARRASA